MELIDRKALKAELIVLSFANLGKSIDIMAVVDAQPTITEGTAQVSPWRNIDDTAGLGDCEPVIARKLEADWYEYEIIVFDHSCHGCKGFRANVDCNEGWTEYQRIPGYQYSVNDALEAK